MWRQYCGFGPTTFTHLCRIWKHDSGGAGERESQSNYNLLYAGNYKNHIKISGFLLAKVLIKETLANFQ